MLAYCEFKTTINNECRCENCGYTVKGRSECPEKLLRQCTRKTPTIIQQSLSFTKAMLYYYKSGRKKVTKEQYEERLKICNGCSQRNGDRCSFCGCKMTTNVLVGKAELPKETCPLGKWPLIPT